MQNNVLISNNHEAVLTDFGLSKVIEDVNRAGSSTSNRGAGALRWKAPELLGIHLIPVTPASDVWAFGCTAYQVFMPLNSVCLF
jgi:serine/threonine protein kinase